MPAILIVKTSSMGDLVHTMPMVTDIVARVPGAHIDWVVEEAFADIPRLHPAVRERITVAVRRWRKNLLARATWREIAELRRRLKARRYDFIIDAQGLIKSAVIARVAEGKRYGRDRASVREPLAARLYDQSFAVAKGRHAVWRNRALAAQIFGYGVAEGPIDYGMQIPAVDTPGLRAPYIMLVHGCSDARRWWAQANWVALARAYMASGIVPVLPWGNAAERANAEAIAREISGAVVLPRLDLIAQAALLKDAFGVIGVDTGLTHLATGLRCRTVTIFNFTPPHLSGAQGALTPWGANAGELGRAPPMDEVVQAAASLGIAPTAKTGQRAQP